MNRLSSTDKSISEATIFLSYSRKDREVAHRVAETLRDRGFDVFRDTDDILPTEEWRGRLEQLINEADTIVFLLSPHSAKSEVCSWEVKLAHSLNKRIAPIVIDDVEGSAIPPLLARLNFIFCTPRDPFENAVDTLVSALNTDIDWIREHTRLAGLTRRWDVAGRPVRLLLRGQDITDAETWRDARPAEAPAVTPDQGVFISESRSDATRRQRNWALGATFAMTAAIVLSVFAWLQSVEADRQRLAAEAAAVEAARQERTALTALAANRLSSDDRAGALEALMAGASAGPVTASALAAGLATPDALFEALEPNQPFYLNGVLFAPSPDGPRPHAFPARWTARLGADWAAISEIGDAVLLRGGAIVDRFTAPPETDPCLSADDEDGPRLISIFEVEDRRFCRSRVLITPVADGRFGEPVTHQPCDDVTPVRMLGADLLHPEDVIQACLRDDRPARGLEGLPVADLPAAAALTFPSALPETPLWRAPMLKGVAEWDVYLNRWGEIRTYTEETLRVPNEVREFFAHEVETLAGAQARLGPSFWEASGFKAILAAVNWGGSGGFVDWVLCDRRGNTGRCAEFSSFGGMRGAIPGPEGDALYLFGADIMVDARNPETGRSTLVRADADGLTPLPEFRQYGAALDLAWSPDGAQGALLTGGVIVQFGREGDAPPRLFSAPPGASAILWPAEEIWILATDDGGLLWGEAAAEDAAGNGWVAAVSFPSLAAGEQGADGRAWIAHTPEHGLVARGQGMRFVIYDMALRAPITGVAALSETGQDHYLGHTLETPRLSVGADGAPVLSHMRMDWVRRAAPPAEEWPALLDPQAPLR